MGVGAKRLPPQGPPGPETHPHAASEVGETSHVEPNGHDPPHVPVESEPHGATHNAEGPEQQRRPPAAVTQMQSRSHSPLTQRSAVQGLSSSQSASVAHSGVGVRRSTGTHAQFRPACGTYTVQSAETRGTPRPAGTRERSRTDPRTCLRHIGASGWAAAWESRERTRNCRSLRACTAPPGPGSPGRDEHGPPDTGRERRSCTGPRKPLPRIAQ